MEMLMHVQLMHGWNFRLEPEPPGLCVTGDVSQHCCFCLASINSLDPPAQFSSVAFIQGQLGEKFESDQGGNYKRLAVVLGSVQPYRIFSNSCPHQGDCLIVWFSKRVSDGSIFKLMPDFNVMGGVGIGILILLLFTFQTWGSCSHGHSVEYNCSSIQLVNLSLQTLWFDPFIHTIATYTVDWRNFYWGKC